MSTSLPRVSASIARRCLLGGAGLLEDPDRPATPARVLKQIEAMGFVQVDTIHSVERAHQHILFTRFDRYRPATLQRLLEEKRSLFEHWTHDASIIPVRDYAQWKYRFAAYRSPTHRVQRWVRRQLGTERESILDSVRRHIAETGPRMSRDFEDVTRKAPGEKHASWWNWKPKKIALEYLWRVGELAVAGRENFQKRYELSERWLPEQRGVPAPGDDEHCDWACSEALRRLVFATPPELRQFFDAISLANARAWCKRGLASGKLVEVEVESADGTEPRRAIAPANWNARVARLRDAPDRLRPISPFDPAIRDRARLKRYFDFDYRFEAFVPAAKRQFGYYVLPLLEGDRLVGRIDPKFVRESGTLEVRKIWWEDGIAATKVRKAALRDGIERFASQIGAGVVRMPR